MTRLIISARSRASQGETVRSRGPEPQPLGRSVKRRFLRVNSGDRSIRSRAR